MCNCFHLFIYFSDYYFYYDYVTLTHILLYYCFSIGTLCTTAVLLHIADLLMEVLYTTQLYREFKEKTVRKSLDLFTKMLYMLKEVNIKYL